MRILPFVGLHIAAISVLWVGVGWFAVALCALSYGIRMFGITAFYHRYFAHRAFRTSRPMQFIGAALGNAAGQRGPLWWAAHHRRHHKHADTERDVHTPELGFLWSHVGWWTDRQNFATNHEQIRDFSRFPELRWLDRFDVVAPLAYAGLMYLIGLACEVWAPSVGTTGAQCFVWGFLISTIALYHATFTINSLCHTFGRRRYATKDRSRNNAILAALTFGEGWHNNHHHYPVAARQGFYWWEYDPTYWILLALRKCGLVRELRAVPRDVRDATIARRRHDGTDRGAA